MIGAAVKQGIDKLKPDVRQVIDKELELGFQFVIERLRKNGILPEESEEEDETKKLD